MYDLLIVGAGPAGLTASIYAACFKLNHLLIGSILGGQMSLAPDILNYPGFDEIAGTELTNKMVEQAKKRGSSIEVGNIIQITKSETGFKVKTDKEQEYDAKTLIIATGVERRKLNIPGETEYTGKGVEYCAKCGRFDYLEKVAVVVGGANAAAQTSLQVAHSAKKVYIIYRGAELRCDPVWLTQIKQTANIEIIYNAAVTEIKGDGQKANGVVINIKNSQIPNGETKELAVDKIFIEIGGVPGTALLIPLGVKMDEGGFIAIDEKLETNVQGLFVAGDAISHKYSIEQITSAVGTGARAATSVFSFLKQQTAPSLWGSSQIKR